MAKQIIPVAMAIFSISLLLMLALITNPQNHASAVLSATDFFTEQADNAVFYWESQNKFVALPQGDTTLNSASPVIGTFIRSSGEDGTEVTTTEFDIHPVKGDQNDVINGNPCLETGGCPAGDAGWTGGTVGLWCGETHCYTLWNGANTAHQLLRFDSAGTIDGYLNLTLADAIASVLVGHDDRSAGIGGVTLFFWQEASASTNVVLKTAGGTLVMGISATSVAQVRTIDEIEDMDLCYNCGGVASSNIVMSLMDCSAAVTCIFTYNPNTNTLTQARTANQLAVDFADTFSIATGSGSITYMGDTHNGFLVSGANGASNIIGKVSIGGVGSAGTLLTSAILGDNNYIKAIAVDQNEDLYYIYTSSGQTTAKVVRVNITDYTKHDEFNSVGSGQQKKSMALDFDTNHRLVLSTNGLPARMVFLENFSAVSDADATVCIDTNGDTITDLCFTDTDGNGVADNGQAGALGAFQSNANITQMGTQWFCAFNIGDACNNDDAQTNGVGILFTIIIIVFSYALLVGIHIMAVKQLHKEQVQVMDMININPILLVIVLFLDVGFAWYLNFIADEIFYTAMVIPLGLSALGIFKAIRGR